MELDRGLSSDIASQALVVWDFDGVISDTEPLQLKAFAQVSSAYGHEPSRSELARYIGEPEDEIWASLRRRFAIDQTIENLIAQRSQVYLDQVAEMHTNWFVLPLLEIQAGLDVPAWIVSSGGYRHIGTILNHLEIEDRFARILCSGSDQDGFPDKRARLDYVHELFEDRVAVVEDRDIYLEIGRSYGWLTIGVQHSLNSLRPEDWDYLLQT